MNLWNFTRWIFSTIVFMGFLLTVLSSSEYNEERELYEVGPWKTPKQLIFAGEHAPLNDLDVREKFDREILINTYWHSQTLLLIKKANRWFPLIEPLLREHNIPEDFKYLAVIESGMDPNAKSPAGAVGFWQILKGTGKELGLIINSEIDERKNIEKSTKAACKYFQKAYKEFGSWALVAASYNAGIPRVKRQLEKQKVNSYYDLYLNTETSRYMYRILAIKEVLNNLKKYGFNISIDDLYTPYNVKHIQVNGSIENLPDFAKEHNTNYKTLKILNPWLTNTSLKNPENNRFTILLPIR
tara:strand:+ start:35 stop:931 length:897 start_codon:yes stop_codon:yes gene_type:complete